MPLIHYSKILPPTCFQTQVVNSEDLSLYEFMDLVSLLDTVIFELCKLFEKKKLDPFILHTICLRIQKGKTITAEILQELFPYFEHYPQLNELFEALLKIYDAYLDKLQVFKTLGAKKKPHQVRALTSAMFEATAHQLRVNELDQLVEWESRLPYGYEKTFSRDLVRRIHRLMGAMRQSFSGAFSELSYTFSVQGIVKALEEKFDDELSPEEFEGLVRELYQISGRKVPQYLLQAFKLYSDDTKTADLTHNIQALVGQLMLLKFEARFGDYMRNGLLQQFAAKHFVPHQQAFERFLHSDADKVQYCDDTDKVEAIADKILRSEVSLQDFEDKDFDKAVLTAFKKGLIYRDECTTYLKFYSVYLDAPLSAQLKSVPDDLLKTDDFFTFYFEFDPLNELMDHEALEKFIDLLKTLPESQRQYMIYCDRYMAFSEAMLDAFLIARSGLQNAKKSDPMLGEITREDIMQGAEEHTRRKCIALRSTETHLTTFFHGKEEDQTGGTRHDEFHVLIASDFPENLQNLFRRMVDTLRILRKGAESHWSKAIWKVADGVYAATVANLNKLRTQKNRGMVSQLFGEFLNALDQLPDEDDGYKVRPTWFTPAGRPSCAGWLLGIDMVFNQHVYERAGLQLDHTPGEIVDLFDFRLSKKYPKYGQLYSFVFEHAGFITGEPPELQLLKLTLFWFARKHNMNVAALNQTINQAYKNPGFRSQFKFVRDNRRALLSVKFSNYIVDDLDQGAALDLIKELDDYAPNVDLEQAQHVYVLLELTANEDPLAAFHYHGQSCLSYIHYPVYSDLDSLLEDTDLHNKFNKSIYYDGRHGRNIRPVVLKVEVPKGAKLPLGERYFSIDAKNIPLHHVCGYYPLNGVLTGEEFAQQLYVYEKAAFVPNPEFKSQYDNVSVLDQASDVVSFASVKKGGMPHVSGGPSSKVVKLGIT